MTKTQPNLLLTALIFLVNSNLLHSQKNAFEYDHLKSEPEYYIFADAKFLHKNTPIDYNKTQEIIEHYKLELILDSTSFGYVFSDIFLKYG